MSTQQEQAEPADQPMPKTPKKLGLIPSTSEIRRLREIAKEVAAARGMTEADAFVRMLTGRELGLPPMASLREIDLIEGKAGLNSRAQVALIRRRGLGNIDLVSSSDTHAEVAVTRSDWPDGRRELVAFTEKDAKRGNLLHKRNWQCHPRSMYVARAQSIAAKMFFQDLFLGIALSADELEADTNEQGRPTEIGPPVVDSTSPAAAPPPSPTPSTPPGRRESDGSKPGGEPPKGIEDLAEPDEAAWFKSAKQTITQLVIDLKISQETWKARLHPYGGLNKWYVSLGKSGVEDLIGALQNIVVLRHLVTVAKITPEQYDSAVAGRLGSGTIESDILLDPVNVREMIDKLTGQLSPFELQQAGIAPTGKK